MMTEYTYDQITDILMRKEDRTTKDVTRQPRVVFGYHLMVFFNNANIATREATAREELKTLGFTNRQIGLFWEEWLRAQQMARDCTLKQIKIPALELGKWETVWDEEHPFADRFENSLRANLKLLQRNHPPAFIPRHPEADADFYDGPQFVYV